jgi:hypothetical protein
MDAALSAWRCWQLYQSRRPGPGRPAAGWPGRRTRSTPAPRWEGCGGAAASGATRPARRRWPAPDRSTHTSGALGARAGADAQPARRRDVLGALDRQQERHRAGLQPAAERRAGAVDLIGGHPAGRHPSLQRTLRRHPGQFGLGCEPDLVGDTGSAPDRPSSLGAGTARGRSACACWWPTSPLEASRRHRGRHPTETSYRSHMSAPAALIVTSTSA